jgi:hypothetical protein
MYADDTSNRYYKELALGEILNVRSLLDGTDDVERKKELTKTLSHTLEISTAANTFYICEF